MDDREVELDAIAQFIEVRGVTRVKPVFAAPTPAALPLRSGSG